MAEESGAEFVMPGDKLRTLARLIHLQEAQRIKTIQFRSEYDRTQYLQESREAYELGLRVLDLGKKVVSDHKDNEVTSSLAHRLSTYAELTTSGALEFLRSLSLRKNYLQKLLMFAEQKQQALFDLIKGHGEIEKMKTLARDIAEDIARNKDVTLEFMRSRQPHTSCFLSSWFRQWSQLRDNTFEHMIVKYKNKLSKSRGVEYGAEFEELDASKQIQVYLEILNSSGRAGKLVPRLIEGASSALILLQLGLMTWDVCSSDHKLETLTKDSTELVAGVGGGIVGEVLGASVATAIFGAVGVSTAVGTVGAAFVCLAGIATGIGAAFVVGACVGWLVDQIFKSGGKKAKKVVSVRFSSKKKVVSVRHPTTEKLIVHVAPMPNGQRLALQLTAGPKQ